MCFLKENLRLPCLLVFNLENNRPMNAVRGLAFSSTKNGRSTMAVPKYNSKLSFIRGETDNCSQGLESLEYILAFSPQTPLPQLEMIGTGEKGTANCTSRWKSLVMNYSQEFNLQV